MSRFDGWPSPMKAEDLKDLLDWRSEHPMALCSRYLTGDWVAQPKLDGCRAFLQLGTKRNNFMDRSDSFPQFADAVIDELAGTILDGEFMAPPRGGESALMSDTGGLFRSGPAAAARLQKQFGPAQFVVFDVLRVGKLNVADQSLRRRGAHLRIIVEWLNQIYPECGIVRAEDHPATEEAVLEMVRAGHEGAVLKRLDSTYQERRSPDWQKVKIRSPVDLVVTGWKAGRNANQGKVGSLAVSVYDPAAPGGFREVGHAGNMTVALRNSLSAADGSLRSEFYHRVVRVSAQGVGSGGRLRHPLLETPLFHETKRPEDCDASQLDLLPKV